MAIGSRTETGLTFTKSGNNFVYEDNPESFSLVPSALHYLWGGSLNTSYKDFEMYHTLYNGNSDTSKIAAGVAVWNGNSSAVTVTYKCATAVTDSTSAKSYTVTPTMQKSFYDASYKTVSVPAKSTVVLSGVSTNFTKGSSKFISYRGQMKASVSTNVYFRIYVAGANKISSVADELFNVSTYESASGTQFCGEITYTQLNATIACNTTKCYRVFAYKYGSNTNEYYTPSTYKSGGATLHNGNFGVRYHLTITGTSGHYIWIEPDWTISGRTQATIVYRFNNGTWVARSTPISTNGCWYLSMPTNSSGNTEVDLILPGGNYGNYLVYFS